MQNQFVNANLQKEDPGKGMVEAYLTAREGKLNREAASISNAVSTKAKADADQIDKTRAYLRESYQNYWNKTDQERNMFDSSDQGKEYKKVVKKYMPEFVGEDGKFIPLPMETKAGGWKPETQKESLEYDKAKEEMLNAIKQKNVDPGTALGALNNAIFDGTIPKEMGESLVMDLAMELKKRLNPNEPQEQGGSGLTPALATSTPMAGVAAGQGNVSTSALAGGKSSDRLGIL